MVEATRTGPRKRRSTGPDWTRSRPPARRRRPRARTRPTPRARRRVVGVASDVRSAGHRRRVPTGPRNFARRLPRPRSAGPDRVVDAVALHAARDAKRHAVRRGRAAVSREVARRADERVSSTPRSTAEISIATIKCTAIPLATSPHAPRFVARYESQLLPEEHRRGAKDGHHGADHRARGDGLVADHLPERQR